MKKVVKTSWNCKDTIFPSRNTLMYTHDFTHSPHLWHEIRFANCRNLWSQRLCGITQTTN